MTSRAGTLSLTLIGLLLLGYALGGKGFAYVGLPPFYIGEIILASCLLLFILAPDFRMLMRSGVLWLIVILDAWCLIQTLPYIEEYGLDALRDAVLYGYSAFAFLVATHMAHPRTIVSATKLYDRVSTYGVILLIVLIPVGAMLGGVSDVDGTSSIPIIGIKRGDLATHLSAVLAFRMLELGGPGEAGRHRTSSIINTLFWTAWLGAMIWVSLNRGALLVLLATTLLVIAFGYGRRRLLVFGSVFALIFTVFAVLDIRIETDRREFSASQIVANVASIVSDDTSDLGLEGIDHEDLEGTKTWRLRWWGDIVDYTLNGDYFWNGKGFGINVADSDGYQTDLINFSLRSPHNANMTMLARAGVPGLALWLLVHGSFALVLTLQTVRLRRLGAEGWARLNVWILACWLAQLCNGTVDVYLESPQGGFWMWSIIGFGLAVVAVENGALRIVQDGELRKFVREVEHCTFAGRLAAEAGKPVLYVTERCVFRLTTEGLELIEVAPGVDIERDILARMDFRPIVDQPRLMDARLFQEPRLGLRAMIDGCA